MSYDRAMRTVQVCSVMVRCCLWQGYLTMFFALMRTTSGNAVGLVGLEQTIAGCTGKSAASAQVLCMTPASTDGSMPSRHWDVNNISTIQPSFRTR